MKVLNVDPKSFKLLNIGDIEDHFYFQKQTEGKRHRGRPRKYPEHFYNIVNGKMKYPGAKERVGRFVKVKKV